MTGPDFTIYKSTHPDVLNTYENFVVEHKQWVRDWLTQVEAWGFDTEKNKPYVTNSAWGPATLIGMSWHPARRNDPLPPFWKKYDKNQSVIEPYRSKQKGNAAVQAEFTKLVIVPDARRDLVKYGMPHHMFLSLSVTTYAMTMVAVPSTLWVKWRGVDPQASDQWWEQVKLTDYYALVEDGKDPFAADDEQEQPDR